MTLALPRLRLAREDDADGVLAIYGPVVRDTVISFEMVPPSASEMQERIRTTLETKPWLVAEADGALAGYAYAGTFRARPAYQWTAEVTVYLHPDWQGRGVGSALYRALLAILRTAGYRSAVGGITLPNPASVALHERLGFRPVGVFAAAGFKFGEWHDVGFWQLELGSDTAPSGPPRPLSSLVGTPEWEKALSGPAKSP
jgi:L-amino acid N-acyltransferase YncA